MFNEVRACGYVSLYVFIRTSREFLWHIFGKKDRIHVLALPRRILNDYYEENRNKYSCRRVLFRFLSASALARYLRLAYYEDRVCRVDFGWYCHVL